VLKKKKTPASSTATDRGINLGRLPGYLGYQVRQAQAAVFRNFAETGSDLGVSPGEFSLLTLVRENPGIHQKSLVRVYKLDKSTLSNSITDLKKRKLIRRVRDEDDRRFYGLWLTEFGAAVLVRATERIETQERRMDSVLAQGERAQLLNLLARISSALD
jgi:DNA-binding MarR family transcriptional regulator